MTAKQKAARANFKKAVTDAQKLRKSNPKLTQAQALKQAFAANKKVGAVKKKSAPKKSASKKSAPKKKAAPKKVAPKKVASKRITDIHKDSKSHNVNIRVVSGINDDILKELRSIQLREVYFTDLLEKILFEEAALKSQTKGKSGGFAKAQLIATRRYIKDLKNILMRLKKQKTALKKDIK